MIYCHYKKYCIGVNCDKLKFEKGGIVKNGKKIYNINKRSFKYGFTSATKIESTEKVNNYIAKYITKELITMSKGQHRYLYSKNLAEPQSEMLFEEDLNFHHRRGVKEMYRVLGYYICEKLVIPDFLGIKGDEIITVSDCFSGIHPDLTYCYYTFYVRKMLGN